MVMNEKRSQSTILSDYTGALIATEGQALGMELVRMIWDPMKAGHQGTSNADPA